MSNSTATTPEIKVWKTIKLGTHKDVETLKADIEAKGVKISEWAKYALAQPSFTMAPQECTVDLVCMTLEEMGFTTQMPLRYIYARGKELGLKLCPAEVGPQLRLQYDNQEYGEWCKIAMQPIEDNRSRARIFDVGHEYFTTWLNVTWGDLDDYLLAKEHIVFAK